MDAQGPLYAARARARVRLELVWAGLEPNVAKRLRSRCGAVKRAQTPTVDAGGMRRAWQRLARRELPARPYPVLEEGQMKQVESVC
eukprot:6180762-Pleurochrysis_carterae.AAC.2